MSGESADPYRRFIHDFKKVKKVQQNKFNKTNIAYLCIRKRGVPTAADSRDPEAEITPVEPDTVSTVVGTFRVQGSSAAHPRHLSVPDKF